ncbi:hypothetical protein J3A83DRAFT_4360406 [Scleroderma citrinum]
MKGIIAEDAGWHFGVYQSMVKQFKEFSLEKKNTPKLWHLRRIIIFSILMNSTNQKANAVPSMLGFFFQSMHMPQMIIKMLAHIGISILNDSITASTQALSVKSQSKLQELRQSLLAAYAYDNFDVNLKSYVSVVEKTSTSLKHLTSGLLFPLSHGATANDLKCSADLWKKPSYFCQFQPLLHDPEVIEKLPLIKTPLTPACAMDINNSTVSGNIQAVVNLLAQGGVYGPNDTCFEDSRSLDLTPYHVIFIPRLFHLKMACANAIWQCLIQPLTVWEDETSSMHDVSQLQPRETIYGSKPGFCCMHQLINHAGIKKNTQWTSLKALAASKPSLNDLKIWTDEIALKYYFLLYEEITYTMNLGDIGHVETCIISWIPILKAVGKHKYATHIANFLLDVHFVYPPGLRHMVQYHMLVNLTGKEKKWQAVDWCVELNNLFTKVKNGGKGPNQTMEQIILELMLVQTYQSTQATIQKNFLHSHLTTKHADPDMTRTFANLASILAVHSPHTFTAGRKS